MTPDNIHYSFNPYLGMNTPPLELDDHVHKVVEKGKHSFAIDYEKRLDYTKFAASQLNLASKITFSGIQGTVLGSSLLYGSELPQKIENLKHVLTIISLPFIAIAYALGTIQLVAQCVQYASDKKVIENLEERGKSVEEKMEWLKTRFFSLDPQEVEKITEYIETHLPDLSNTQKAFSFDRIAEKTLDIQFEIFKRKVTPKLAEKVKEDLKIASNEMSSWRKKIQAQGKLRAQILVDSVADQVKSRLSVHAIASATIVLSFATLTLALMGSIALPLTLILNTFALIGVAAEFFYETQVLKKGAENYELATSTIQWQKEASEAGLQA